MFDSLKLSAKLLSGRDRAVTRLVAACRQLLSEEGEASGATRARETLALYAALDATQRARFFDALKRDFSPRPEAVLEAAHAYAHEPSSLNLAVLTNVVEPPRQELLRRLNRTAGGTHNSIRPEVDPGESLLAVEYELREHLPGGGVVREEVRRSPGAADTGRDRAFDEAL